jgi:hypothetical protein
MCDNSFFDRFPRINIKLALRATKTFVGEFYKLRHNIKNTTLEEAKRFGKAFCESLGQHELFELSTFNGLELKT